jgi:uncharacterized protein
MSKQLEDFPLFPIPIIVFPGEIQPLHIYEPRYKQLIADMQKENGMFGIPYYFNGKICEYGSLVTIHKILAKSPSGEMDILVRGVNLFKIKSIHEFLDGKLDGGGTIELLNEMNQPVSPRLIERYKSYKKQLSSVEKNPESDSENEIQIFTPNQILDIAGQLPFEIDEKYQIIKSLNHLQREQFVMEKINFLLMINKKVKEVGYKFYLN